MTRAEWHQLLKDWFLVPRYPCVYILGSFARHVTLYSQQVRALNLVAGLVETGEISEGRDVVVVGGGAAGLTAAAAAARRKANVVVLEALEDLMELQGNNRQRWLHPYIYDWPDVDPNKHESDLPFLNWKADYAESVARTITKEWERLAGLWNIDVRLNTESVQIDSGDHETVISWKDETERETHIKHGALIILAVGFGLEPTTEYGDSYWAEDNIDGSFRPVSPDQRWLVSGFGDGALTDLIRLCLRRFRHGEILQLFENVIGIRDIKDQLRDMHASPSATAGQLTKAFQKLAMRDLIDTLRPRVRRHGPKLFLAGKDLNPYGPSASILNRLVVCVLQNMGAFTLLLGPVNVKGIKPGKNGYDVPLGKGKVEPFNRIILRHGPTPGGLEKQFDPIADACEKLSERWKNLSMRQDKTRTKLWPDDFYGTRADSAPVSAWIQNVSIEQFSFTNKEIAIVGPKIMTEEVVTESTMAITGPPLEVQFAHGAKKFGVRASAVEVIKRIRNDGVATLDYVIRDLSLLSGELKGIRFYYQSIVGQVGRPILDVDARRVGLHWEDDPAPSIQSNDFESIMAATRERLRKLAGTVWFDRPRTEADPPLSFGWSVTMLGADALSLWEYNQIYSMEDRVHINGEILDHPTEYLARVVWFPVETLKLAITLPSRSPGPAFPGYFLLDDNQSIPVEDVIRGGLLQIYPPPDCVAQLPTDRWKRQEADALVQGGQFTRVSPLTWELTVPRPEVGSCYSLDWHLPGGPQVEEDQLERETSAFRRQLLSYRNGRLRGKGNSKVRKLIAELAEKICDKYGGDETDENVTISMLTYDEESQRLRFVDGSLNGRRPSEDMWNLWLPFGAGLAGACFKQQADFPFIYFAPENGETRIGPETYLPLPGQVQHNVLLAIPLTHPEYTASQDSGTFETARLRIAVLDIGSDSSRTKLREFRGSNMTQNFQELVGWSRAFVESLVSALREVRDRADA